MAGTKETPRQKLIGLMYLVLTALLALNVSKDVLNAFVVMNENIELSNEIFEKKINDIYVSFESNYILNPQKVKPFWEKAVIARKLSSDMVDYIDSLKFKLIARAEGVPVDSAKNINLRDIRKKDENSLPTNFFLGNTDDGKQGAARPLKEKIDSFKIVMMNLVDPKFEKLVDLGLDTKGPFYDADGDEQIWELHFFLNTIIAADIALLNKIILDVNNAEFEIVNLLYKSIGQGDFKFEKIEAKIVPKSNFVFIGSDYDAEIIVAAYDTSSSPKVYYSSGVDYFSSDDIKTSNILETNPGAVRLVIPAHTEGVKKYAGIVRAKSSTGFNQDYHFSGEYIVARPTTVITAKKMNVLYIGVLNPISIIMSGIPKEDLIPSISCGTIRRDSLSDDWIVRIPPGHSSAVIKISAVIDGVKKEVGNQLFRVKKLPDPTATIANKNSGSIKREIIIAAGAISPKLPDDFDFDYQFTISSFTMTIQRGFVTKHYNSKNAYLTTEMNEQILKTNRGQTIVFENIIALDPNNISRQLSPIVLTIN